MDIVTLLRTLLGENAPVVPANVSQEFAFAPALAPPGDDPEFERLPAIHRALLREADGLSLLGNSYRLFGWAHGRRLSDWNDAALWKFAWQERAADYYCIGESVLGNQFAYRFSELQGSEAPRVYELYAVTLDEICSFPDFTTFLVDGFVNGVQDDAYHRRIAAARAASGGVFPPDEHRAYMPSPLLSGGQVANAQLVPLPAHVHMTFNGDLFGQLAHRDTLAGLFGLETSTDDRDRPRIRAIWGPPTLQ